MPDLSFEMALPGWPSLIVAGVDEVGRGPLAGPVTAGAVILNPANLPDGLNDSKKLTARRREALAPLIHATALVGIGHASVEEIDDINILQASHLAMRRAVAALPDIPEHLLIDGNRLPADLPCPATTVIKGDGRSLSIAAASIVAKVARDQIMVDLAQQFPDYGWDRNAGYGTAQHISAIIEKGVTPHHRRSFKPIHNILYQDSFVSH